MHQRGYRPLPSDLSAAHGDASEWLQSGCRVTVRDGLRGMKVTIRSIVLSVVLGIGVYAPTCGAEPAAADPVLAEASDLASYVMFAESGAPGMVLVVVRGNHSVVLG